MLEVADLTDRRAAIHMHLAELAGRETEECIAAFLRHELSGSAGTACELGTLADLELDIVHHRADGDVFERERVADLDVCLLTGLDHVADLEAVRSEDVTLLTIDIVEERDARATVRIVLDRRNASGDAVLVALEVDHAIEALVTAALVADRQATLLIAAALLRQALRQRLFRFVGGDLIERCHRHETTTCRIWFETLYCHWLNLLLFVLSLEELDAFASSELHDGLFIVRALTRRATHAFRFAKYVDRIDLVHLHVEDFRNGFGDLDLVGCFRNNEDVFAFCHELRRTLRDERTDKDFTCFHYANTSSIRAMASFVMNSLSELRISNTLSPFVLMAFTP